MKEIEINPKIKETFFEKFLPEMINDNTSVVCEGIIEIINIVLNNFNDNFVNSAGEIIKQSIERFKKEYKPLKNFNWKNIKFFEGEE